MGARQRERGRLRLRGRSRRWQLPKPRCFSRCQSDCVTLTTKQIRQPRYQTPSAGRSNDTSKQCPTALGRRARGGGGGRRSRENKLETSAPLLTLLRSFIENLITKSKLSRAKSVFNIFDVMRGEEGGRAAYRYAGAQRAEMWERNVNPYITSHCLILEPLLKMSPGGVSKSLFIS